MPGMQKNFQRKFSWRQKHEEGWAKKKLGDWLEVEQERIFRALYEPELLESSLSRNTKPT